VKVFVRKAALNDVSNTMTWLSDEDSEAANRFLAAIEAEFTLLSAHPFLGRRRFFKTRNIRSWRVRGFEKHLVYYLVNTDSIDVIRVLHGARDVKTML
jgi:toxin ParE1/3/4